MISEANKEKIVKDYDKQGKLVIKIPTYDYKAIEVDKFKNTPQNLADLRNKVLEIFKGTILHDGNVFLLEKVNCRIEGINDLFDDNNGFPKKYKGKTVNQNHTLKNSNFSDLDGGEVVKSNQQRTRNNNNPP